MADPRSSSDASLLPVSRSDRWREQTVPVSAILITYNQAEFVEQALRSVLAQTYTLQLIISDDASQDATEAILRRLLAAYNGPHAVTLRSGRRNLGVCGNQNAALALADGELIMLCEGDDLSAPQRAERLVQRYLELGRRVAALGSGIRVIGRSGEPRGAVSWRPLRGDAWSVARHQWPIHGCSLMLRRDCFTELGPITRGLLSGDIAIWLRAAFLRDGGLAQIPEPLVEYRLHGENVSGAHALDYTSRVSLQASCRRLCRNEVAQIVELEKIARYRTRSGNRDPDQERAWQVLSREARARAQLLFAILRRSRAPLLMPALRAFRHPALRRLAINALALAYAPWALAAYRRLRPGRLRRFGD